MRRATSGLLIVCILFSAVGMADGPLRRLLGIGSSNQSIQRTFTRQTTQSPVATNCPNGTCPLVTQSSVIASPPVISVPVVASYAAPVIYSEPAYVPRSVGDRVTVSAAAEVAITETEASDGFRRQLVNATQKARRAGTISIRDAAKIRVAMFSPAFRASAEDLCVVQMAFSGDAAADDLPRNASGEIERTAIDWEGFASFLERILPLILQLLSAFGA